MLDLIPYRIIGIMFLTQDSDLSPNLLLGLDLEISTNRLNVIIVTLWVILQTIASDVKTEIFPRRQQNQGRRNNFRNLKQYTNYRTDTRYRNDNVSQCRVNFSELPMYSDLETGNHQ